MIRALRFGRLGICVLTCVLLSAAPTSGQHHREASRTLAGGAAVRTTLRWSFRPHDIVRYETRTVVDGPSIPQTDVATVLDEETLAIERSGEARVRLSVPSIRTRQDQFERLARHLRIPESMRDAHVDFTRDDRGNVSPPADSTDADVRARIGSIAMLAPVLPDHAVRPGDAWSDEREVPLALGLGMALRIRARATYRLRSLGTGVSGRVAFDTAMHVELATGSNVSGAPVDGAGDWHGSTVVDLSRGVVLASELGGELRVRVHTTARTIETPLRLQWSLRMAGHGEQSASPSATAPLAIAPVPWLTILGIDVREAAAHSAAPGSFPHYDMTDVTTFPYDDEHLLDTGQHDAGAVWVTPNAQRGATLPLLIYLHGTNRSRVLHRWMHGSDRDMRTIVGPLAMDHAISPMAVAVPSTTGESAQSQFTLYPHFDVARFVDAVDAALAARGFHVDRRRVIFSAHSASGCVRGNGLLAGIGSSAAQTILDIDCCMNEETATALATAPAGQRVIVAFQDHMWNFQRDYSSFHWAFERHSAGIEPANRVLRYYALTGVDAHNEIVPIVLREWLPVLVPP